MNMHNKITDILHRTVSVIKNMSAKIVHSFKNIDWYNKRHSICILCILCILCLSISLLVNCIYIMHVENRLNDKLDALRTMISASDVPMITEPNIPDTTYITIIEPTTATTTSTTTATTTTTTTTTTAKPTTTTKKTTTTAAPTTTAVSSDVEMLACVIYQESGGNASCDNCRKYVGDIVLNRVNDPRFPNTIYGVLTQKNQYGRFYYTGIVWPSRAKNPGEAAAVDRAYRVARELLSGNHSSLYGAGYVWQAQFKQGTDGFWCCDHFYGR